MIKKNNYYSFKVFKNQPELVHGVSTRQLGDMTALKQRERKRNQERFLNLLGFDGSNLVTMEQVHNNRFVVVDQADRGREIKGVDGLITQDRGVILGVKSADCLPIVAFEARGQILGVAHAGWQGTIKKIGQALVEKMVSLGAGPKRVLVGIGPHVRSCCYQVEKERAKQFLTIFGNLARMVNKKKGSLYLGLAVALKAQLVEAGIAEKNIETSGLCTNCQNNQFFSFRKEGRPFGEFLTVATMKE